MSNTNLQRMVELRRCSREEALQLWREVCSLCDYSVSTWSVLQALGQLEDPTLEEIAQLAFKLHREETGRPESASSGLVGESHARDTHLSPRGQVIKSISEAKGCSLEEAQRVCARIERVRPRSSYEAMLSAVQQLGERFSEERVILLAREIHEELREQAVEELKRENTKEIMAKSKKWRPGKRVNPGKMKRRDLRRNSGVKHWRG